LRRLDTGFRFEPEAGHHPWRARGLGIPLLEEVLRTFPQVRLNLDLKQARTAAAVAAEIDRLGAEDRVLVGAFYDVRVRAFRRHSAGKVATAAGPGEVLAVLAAARVGRVLSPRYDALQIPERIASGRLVRAAHAAGVQVHVWTVNDPAAMHRLLDLGVDGIVSDRPDLLADVVTGRSG
jgi:glycerophosphoryl diester phosphodiesterase